MKYSSDIKGLLRSGAKLLSILFVSTIIVCACSDDDHPWNNNGGSNGSGTNNYPSPNPAITSRMETPRVLNDGTTVLISHDTKLTNGKTVMTYELEYDINKYHSRWVAFRFDGDTRAKTTGRNDAFADDPSLSSTYHIGSSGFGWDYNRGHLCASADRLYSVDANMQTFYMTNMSPQIGNFNGGYWVTLEGLVQSLGRNATFADTLYVVKGGTIKDNQIMDYVTRPNGKKVAVPKYYYMALLKVKNGGYSSIAFWMEHKDYGYDYNKQAPLSEIKKTVVTVNQLEELTGIDFFPNLPDASEEIIESQNMPSVWGM